MSELLRENAFTYLIVTPPVEKAVTLAEFKAFAKITNAAEDSTLQIILDSAIAFGQSYTRRTFITTEFKTFLDEFIPNFIELRKSPFQNVTSFKYYNESNVLVDVDALKYMTTQESDYSKIALLDGSSWPSDMSSTRPFQSVEIRFNAGYGATSASVPESLKVAIMSHALNAVRNRGDCVDCSCGSSNLPPVSCTLYNQFRIREIRLGF